MRNSFFTRVTVVTIVACIAVAVTLVTAQAPNYRAPRARRQAKPQWHLAGDQYRQLRHRGTLGGTQPGARTGGLGRHSRRSRSR